MNLKIGSIISIYWVNYNRSYNNILNYKLIVTEINIDTYWFIAKCDNRLYWFNYDNICNEMAKYQPIRNENLKYLLENI